jgi:hypothetical protein
LLPLSLVFENENENVVLVVRSDFARIDNGRLFGIGGHFVTEIDRNTLSQQFID